MHTRWVRRDDVLSRAQLGEVLLLAPDGTEPIALTAPGDVLWQLLATPQSIDELVDAFTTADDDDGDGDGGDDRVAVRGAIDALLRRLHRQGVITATG